MPVERRFAAVLQPFVSSTQADHHLLISYGDGTADIYLSDDGMMANHIAGHDPWDLLVEAARAAGWVILPSGCPTCLTDPGQRTHLPEGLDADVVLVLTGTDLLSHHHVSAIAVSVSVYA